MRLRYWQTVRHLQPSQILSRVRLRAGSAARSTWPSAATALYRRRVTIAGLSGGGIDRETARVILALRVPREQPLDPRNGRFTFVGETAGVGWPPDWSAAHVSQLWRYHVHYFDYLPDVDPQTAGALIEDWIDANPVHGRGATPDAWHPYVASVRMVNWMLALAATKDEISDRVTRSLAQHALFLERNLEADVRGNHLLKNLKAMTFAGCFWNGPRGDSWRREFSDAFVRELERQLLPDGAHYERSPMYHCQVMADAIETSMVLGEDADPVTRQQLRACIARMNGHLAAVTHPDGGIALFNDSAFGMAPEPAVLYRAATALDAGDQTPTDPTVASASSGYVSIPPGNPDRFLLADVGAVCPDELPAHAHADLLSFEVSVNGRRMIIDSGVGEYKAGRWRDYYRSTRAHNTVSVDGREQSDCWGSFRVGRRAEPANVSVTSRAGETALEGEHTGFDVAGVRHRRRFTWSNDVWSIEDTLTGSGGHAWESFLHFHPAARIVDQELESITIARDDAQLQVRWRGFARARVVRGEETPLQGWYADHFGAAAPAPVLVLEGQGTLPAEFGYVLIPR